jgi:hypothetical protein
MNTTIKSRYYRVKNISVELSLVRMERGMDVRYAIFESFKGTKHKNNIIRGVFNDMDVARVEFKNIANNLERTLPISDFSLA